MSDSHALDEQSPAVRTHLEMMQGVIERMAGNSRSCKVWCVTLVAAVLVLVARTGEAQHALIALLPTALFLVLDAYYLALERAFISSYDRFVSRLHGRSLFPEELFVISPLGSIPRMALHAVLSFSIWPFYALILATTLLAWLVII